MMLSSIVIVGSVLVLAAFKRHAFPDERKHSKNVNLR